MPKKNSVVKKIEQDTKEWNPAYAPEDNSFYDTMID